MNTIQLSDIIIKPNRQRTEFDPDFLQELKNSIEDRGLMHAPVLRNEDDSWVLVAGERRLKAIEELFTFGSSFRYNGQTFCDGEVPFTDIGQLSHLEAEEAELDENLKRRDLTWQEHAAAVQRLHALRQAQATEARDAAMAEHREKVVAEGSACTTIPSGAHTIADTAREVTGRSDGAFHDKTRKEIIVAQNLHVPEVAKAKNVDEAFKLLKRKEEREKNVELALAVGASFSSESHCLLNTNCLEWMASPVNNEQFDVILTDPPYGMGADEFGDAAGKLQTIDHQYDDSYESWQALMREWCPLSFAVAKPQAHAYVFCDIDRFHELKQFMQDAGWYVFRTPLVIHKLNSGRVPLPDQGPRRQWEMALYAIKGKKPVTHIYPDVIACNGDDNLGHGAQKPVALYQNLLQRSVKPGDKVLDCFAGSGTIFPAAHTYKVSATGLEMSPAYYAIGLKRIQQLDDQGELPV